MRFLRLHLLVLLLMVVASPSFAQNWVGIWSGTTSQGKPISITVDGGNHITTVSFGGIASTGCFIDFGTMANLQTPPSVSAAGAFAINAPSTVSGSVGFTMTGTLATTGTGSGSTNFNFNGIPSVPSKCDSTGSATFTVSRQGGPPGTVAAILAVVGSVQGAAFFRTEVQIHNPRATAISGVFVYHPQGTSGLMTDPSLGYTIQAGSTIDYPDLLPAMGQSGLGSLDIVTSDPVPIMVARVFSDAGDAGTAGFTLDPVAPSAALQAGDSGVIIAPSDPAKTRLNIGIRSLDTGVSMQVILRNKNGFMKGTVTKTLAPNWFEQPSAAALLTGLTLDGSDSITFAINSGKAIIYGASTENKTQDPSLQYAKKTF